MISVYDRRDHSREDNKLSENIHIYYLFVKTRYLKKTCSQSLVLYGPRVHGFTVLDGGLNVLDLGYLELVFFG
jgi:hypothetical protein